MKIAVLSLWLSYTALADLIPLFTFTPIPALSAAHASPTGMNNAGQIVGTANGHAFLYDGTMHDLGTLPGKTQSVATGINARGDVIGRSGSHAFLYDGTMHDLGISSVATGINARGQVVGYSWSGPASHAFLYDGAMHDLGTLPGKTQSVATGINDRGQVIGYSYTDHDEYHAFIYDGAMHDLGTLEGRKNSTASAINDAGQVVGTSWTTNPLGRAFLYDGTIHDLGTLPNGDGSSASAINNSGVVLGYSWIPSPPWVTLNDAVLFRDGNVYAVNSQLDISAFGWVFNPVAIDDIGQILATGYFYPDVASGKVNVGFGVAQDHGPAQYGVGILAPCPTCTLRAPNLNLVPEPSSYELLGSIVVFLLIKVSLFRRA
jgi:probable HAF family extracellular repeat protein